MPHSTHLTDDELVAALDGELSPADTVRADDHITACWTCRTRREELASVIADFVRAREAVLLPHVPPPAPWQGLEPRLAQLDAQQSRLAALWRSLRGFGNQLVAPGPWRTAVAGAALFAIVIVVVQSLSERPLAAAEVLARARPVDTLDGHRQLTIEQRDGPSGRLLVRHRIDVWHKSASRVTARRLLDEQGRIIAGEWSDGGSTRTIYARGQSPRIEPSTDPVPLTQADAWRLSPAAATFTQVTSTNQQPAAPALSESDDSYTVSAPLASIADATIALTVRKADMHPVAHTLTFGATVVSMVETAFEETPAALMPASVFEPDRDLLHIATIATSVPAAAARPGIRTPLLTSAEAAALEVDALLRLDAIGALLGEEIAIVRSPGAVHIEARTESEHRRDELRDALAQVAAQPGARVDVQTFATAESTVTPTAPPSVRIVEFAGTRSPVYDELRSFFLDRAGPNPPDAASIENAIQRVTRTVLERSLRARLQARAIVQLTTHISPADMRTLDDRRALEWWGAVNRHARAFEDETRTLRVDLEPLFYASAIGSAATVPPPADVWERARQLLTLAASHDADLGRAFARSVEVPGETLAVRSPRFRESLIAAEALAASMQVTPALRR